MKKTFQNNFWHVAPWMFVVLWSGGYGFSKLAFPYIEPLTMLVIRYALVLAIILPVAFILKINWPKSKKHWANIFVTGFFIQVIYFGFIYIAMKAGVAAGTAAIIMALQPMVVGVLAPLFLKERTSIITWLGLTLGLFGTSIVIWNDHQMAPSPLFAIIFALISLGGIVTATLWEKKFGQPTHPIANGIGQYVVGLICMTPIALTLETQNITFHPDLIIAFSYLIFGNSIIAISLLMGIIARGEAVKVSSLFFLVPPFALLLAWLLLGETITIWTIIGLILSVIGIIIVNRKSQKH